MSGPILMDVTLRDGAYLFDHDVPLDTVRNIAACLDEAGIPLIEIGHGMGVGAREAGVYPNGAEDLDTAHAARDVVKRAKLGMLASALFTKPDQLKALKPSLDFIRIGTNVDSPQEAVPLIEVAQNLDYQIFFQMMRSSRVPPKKAAEAAHFLESVGVDGIYLVDSAGGWSPWQVKDYVAEVLSKTNLPLGIHAHDHLGVALANTLAGIESGCRMADASLRGIGRGAGNVQMELLVIHLERLGLEGGIDQGILEVASRLLEEELSVHMRGVSPDDYLPARRAIDLYPLPLFMKICDAAGIDLTTLLDALGGVPEMTEVTQEALSAALRSLGRDPSLVFKRADIPYKN